MRSWHPPKQTTYLVSSCAIPGLPCFPVCFVIYQDIEFAAQDASSLVRPGCVAAFSEQELGGDLQVSMYRATILFYLSMLGFTTTRRGLG